MTQNESPCDKMLRSGSRVDDTQRQSSQKRARATASIWSVRLDGAEVRRLCFLDARMRELHSFAQFTDFLNIRLLGEEHISQVRGTPLDFKANAGEGIEDGVNP